MLVSTKHWIFPRREFGSGGGLGGLRGFAPIMALALAATQSAFAADLEDARKLFRSGRYDECLRMADLEIATELRSEPWRDLKIKSELATGKYPEAIASFEDALRPFSASISLRLLGRQVYRLSGRDQE